MLEGDSLAEEIYGIKGSAFGFNAQLVVRRGLALYNIILSPILPALVPSQQKLSKYTCLFRASKILRAKIIVPWSFRSHALQRGNLVS